MIRYFIFICLLTCQLPLLAQSSRQQRVLRKDSLRKVLPSLKDIARVDCLNELVWESDGSLLLPYGQKFKGLFDSARNYAVQAKQEAVKIEYQYGHAMSLIYLAWFDVREKINLKTAKTYIDEAILIGETIKSDKILGMAYLTLGFMHHSEMGLEFYKKSQGYFQKAQDRVGELQVTILMCMDYLDKGKNEEGFDYCDKCINLAEFVTSKSTHWQLELVQWSFYHMSRLYEAAGDYQTAIEYLHKSDQYAIANEISGWDMDMELSEMFCQLSMYDSALFYWHRWEKERDFKSIGNQACGDNILGQIYLGTKRYDEALKLFEATHKTIRGDSSIDNVLYSVLSKTPLLTAKVYVEKKKWETALIYATEGFSLAKKMNARHWMMDSYELLSQIYHGLGKDDQAYANFKQYTLLKDSVLNRRFLWRLNTYKKTAEDEKEKSAIELLSKDNQIKDEQLKQENLLKKFLIAALVGLALMIVFIYRTLTLKQRNERLNRTRLENDLMLQKLESEKNEAELQQQASELEMQALRAQMSPHFIFNCLSSINRFILKNESEAASDYLTRFSRLIRLVLNNSKQSLISLEDELEMLRLYIEMERLRFQNSFDFNIGFKNEIDASAINIPPLLLQPFAENAIWHGLMNKEGHKQLDFYFATNERELICSITDNGVGRQKAQELKSKKDLKGKSMGLQITANRLAIFNKESDHNTSFHVEDLFDDQGNAVGTKVTLKIRTKDIWKTPATLESVA